MEKYILSVVVKNHSGVLARVASLFGRRGFNIDSLTVSATTDPQVSRMSIIVTGDERILEQIMKQVAKLEETLSVDHLKESEALCKELVFVKVRADDPATRDSIREVAELYHAKELDTGENSLIVQFTDVPSRIDAFLTVIANFDVIETCRSGVTAMSKA
jgi:acetolactate synthase-1/3 small subunit